MLPRIVHGKRLLTNQFCNLAAARLQQAWAPAEMDLGTFLNLECPAVSPEEACHNAWKHPNREVIIDVRAPCEFAEGHIHGAINVPLFEDKQRADIGTLYKSEGKLPAIELGKSLIQPRLALLTSMVLPFKSSARIDVCCARGGMRSRSFANFLAFNGFEVQQIIGGYRDYRLTLISQFEKYFESTTCLALAGRTGVGKTLLLQALAERLSNSSLDLEGFAQHRSSMFGGFGKVARTQQQFESEMRYHIWLHQQSSSDLPVFVEAEGSKIGNIHLPLPLRLNLDRGPHILCTASIDTRIERLVKEYWFDPSDKAAIENMQRITNHHHLLKKLGSVLVNRLQACLLKHDLHEFVYLLLKNYYDILYDHSIREKSAYSLILDTDDLPSALDTLIDFRANYVPNSN